MMNWYDAIFKDIWPFWVGGPAIGLFALAFAFFQKRLLSASGTYHGVLEAMQGKGDPKDPHWPLNEEKGDLPVAASEKAPRWRVYFFIGLALGGFASGMGGGNWGADKLLRGMGDLWNLGALGQAAVLLVGGVFIGFGTRFAGGCTSGHAIVGISARQLPSLVATAVFFAVGMLTTFIISWVR